MNQSEFVDMIQKIVYKVLRNENILTGEWHLGFVSSVLSPYLLSVFVDGSSNTQTIPCNPNVKFLKNDEVFVHFVNGDTKNKFVPFKRATGTEITDIGYRGNQVVTANSTSVSVTFGSARVDNNYAISIVPSWNTTFWFSSKTSSGFTINFATAPTTQESVDWTTTQI